jgi:predicted nucleic acid-binding protein
MIPLRLVIDTNVVVSATRKPEGLQRTVVLLAMTKPELGFSVENAGPHHWARSLWLER